MKRIGSLLLLAGILVACQDSDLTRPDPRQQLSPTAPDAEISEQGNGHFFFLPPLDSPDADGEFNPNLLTEVEICEWDQGNDECVDDPIQTFSSDEITVDEDEEEYHVNWNIRRTQGVETGTIYAIRVLTADIELGFAEIAIGRNGRQANQLASQFDVVGLVRNRTLPIKYRAESGIFCDNPDGCVEVTVTDDTGGTVTTQEEDTGVEIPAGALPAGEEEVVVIVEEIELQPGEECLEDIGVLTTAGRCVQISTEPKLTQDFEDDVIVGICVDETGIPDFDRFQIHRFDPDNPGQGVEALPSAAALFLDCSSFSASLQDAGPIRRLAHTGWQTLLRIVGPAPLAARDEGFGGVTSRFSFFQWARPVTLTATSDQDQPGITGEAVDDEPTVRVLTAHNDANPPVPVSGHPVVFEFFDVGGASLGEDTVPSDANGFASTAWTLTANEGVQSVHATGFNAGPVVFEADALDRGLIAKWSGDGTVTGGTTGSPGTISDDEGNVPLSTAGSLGTGPGVVGQAMEFTRDDPIDNITGSWAWGHPAERISDADRLSVSFWVNMNTLAPQFQRMFSIFGGRFVVRADDDDLVFFMFGFPPAEREVRATDALQVGCWHHVAATFDGSTLSLYLDGQLSGASTPTSGVPVAGDGVFLSNSNDGGGWPPLTGANAAAEKLSGAMDEMEVHNTGLTAAEVQQRFDAAVNAGTPNLCAVGPNLQASASVTARSSTEVNELFATVTNAGADPADPSSVALLVDGETTSDPGTILAVPALAPGAQATVSRRVSLAANSNRVLTAIADVNGDVQETNEGDNQDATNFAVSAGSRGLVSYYSADNTLADSESGHDLAQQAVDPVLFDASGLSGSAFRFSRTTGAGNGALRAAGHPLGLADHVTTSFWVNIDPGSPFSGGGEQRWFNLTGGQEKMIVRQNGLSSGDNARNLTTFGIPGFGHTEVGVLQSGCWHHIVVSYDGTSARMYLDNQLLWTQPPHAVPVFALANFLQLGAPGSEQVVGRVDEINVYNKVLSAAEVAGHFMGDPASFAGLCSPPPPQLDQQNLLDNSIGGQGIGRFNDGNGAPDPTGSTFDHQDAQTFTVGVAGQLNEIRVPVFNLDGGTLPVTMEIVGVTGGVPDESQSFGAVNVPASALPTTFDPTNTSVWVPFDLSSLNILAGVGQQLAYILRTEEVEGYLYNPEINGNYAGGIGYRRNAAVTATWSTFGQDFGFQTFMIPGSGF